MIDSSDLEQAERLAFEACQTAGSELAEMVLSKFGLEAFEPAARSAASAFAASYVPTLLAKLGMTGDAEALERAVDCAMEAFDRRLAELRSNTAGGGMA